MYLWKRLDETGLFDHAKTEFPDKYQAQDDKVPNCLARRSSLSSKSKGHHQDASESYSNSKLDAILDILNKQTKKAQQESIRREERSNIAVSMNILNNYITQVKEDINKHEKQKKTLDQQLFESEEKMVNAEVGGVQRIVEFHQGRCIQISTKLDEVKEKIKFLEEKCDALMIRMQKCDLILQKLSNFLKYEKLLDGYEKPQAPRPPMSMILKLIPKHQQTLEFVTSP